MLGANDLVRDPVHGDPSLAVALRELPLPPINRLLFESSPVRGGFAVVPSGPSRRAWLVVGPVAGRYLSRLEVAGSEAAARTIAARWAAETGLDFLVTNCLHDRD